MKVSARPDVRLFHMLPAATTYSDRVNGRSPNAKGSGERGTCHAYANRLANLPHVVFRELGSWVAASPWGATLCHHVAHVEGVIPQLKVGGPHTSPVVTNVHYEQALRDRSVDLRVAKPVRLRVPERSVPSGGFTAHPEPASIGLDHSRPEPFGVGAPSAAITTKNPFTSAPFRREGLLTSRAHFIGRHAVKVHPIKENVNT